MSWGDGLKAGIEKAAQSGVEVLPYAANEGLRAVVWMAYTGLPDESTGPVNLRANLARIHAELGYNSVEPNPLDPGARQVVLANLVSTFRPGTVGQGPGQSMDIGSGAGVYSPMIPASWSAPTAPLARRAGDLLETASHWADAHAGQVSPELLEALASVGSLWDDVKDKASAAASAAGAGIASVFDPMSAVKKEVESAAMQLAKWVGLGLVAAAGFWLATKKGGGKAGDPWA